MINELKQRERERVLQKGGKHWFRLVSDQTSERGSEA
jgi:hypothetical protein